MKAKKIVITMVSTLIGLSAYAKQEEKSLENYTAQATANVINELGTMNNYLAWMGKSLKADDFSAAKDYMKKLDFLKITSFQN